MGKNLTILVALTLLLALLASCGASGASQAGEGIPDNAAVKITGQVDTEVGWTEDEVRAMDTVEVESTNKDGETKSYTGVPLNELIDMASPKGTATALVFVGDDGSTAEVALADVKTCENCIVSFRNKGGFSMVLPGFPGEAQIKGVVEIQVK